MQFIMNIFGWPMGWIMFALYFVIPNYGIALILFTILTKLLLFPLSLKQQKEQAKMAFFRPKLDAIQKKYANNKEKYNEEIQKIYTEEHYNPLSGCLPTLIQFPLLFGLIDVIYKPMTHLLRLGAETIDSIRTIATGLGMDLTRAAYTEQITLLNSVQENPGAYSSIGAEALDKLLGLDMTFLGLDFTQTPQFALTVDGAFNVLLLIPVLSGLTSLLMSMTTMKSNAAAQGDNAQANAMSRSMMLMMPIFSVYIAFIVPAGVGFYWLVSNVFAIGQTLYLNKRYNPKEMAEKMAAEQEASKEEKRRVRLEAKKKLADGTATAEEQMAALSQKELNRRKLAEARRRDAEKYGEEYVEVTDEDLK